MGLTDLHKIGWPSFHAGFRISAFIPPGQAPLGKTQDGVTLHPGLICPELFQSELVHFAMQQFFIFV